VTTAPTSSAGRFRVETASGAIYLLDLDAHTMIRMKADSGDPDVGASETSLIEVVDCRIGRPLRLLVSLPLPGIVQTKWRATPVVSIEEITDGP